MGKKLEVEILGDASSLQRAFRNSSQEARGLGGHLGSLAKTAGLTMGAAALGGIAFVLKTGIGEWQQSQKVTAQTAAVLKSTGGAANVAMKQITDLSGAIMKKTGIDDEAIQSGENLLLTFTRIRNEAGKGNDIFTQSTRVMTDMSVSLGQDMKSSAIQLGKALNDPIKGVTALQRVGVSFTEGQKESIKAMVDSGNQMGAQKLILAELNTEFGGSAEAVGKTLPGQLNIARETFNNFAGDLVGKSIPAITSMVNYVVAHWPQIKATIVPIMNQVREVIRAVLADAEAFWDRFGGVIMTSLKNAAVVVKASLQVIKDVFQIFGDLLRGDWSALWTHIKALAVDSLHLAVAELRAQVGQLLGVGKALGGAFVDGMSSGLSALGNALERAIKIPINAVISAWDAIGFSVTIPSIDTHVPGIGRIGGGSLSFQVPQIPHLDTGGLILQSGIAMVHKGESVIPAGKGGGNTYNFSFPNYVGSHNELIETVVLGINQMSRGKGQVFVTGAAG